MNFKETLNEKTARIEDMLAKFLPKEEGFQKTVIDGRDMENVWRNRRSGGTFYGGNRDDT